MAKKRKAKTPRIRIDSYDPDKCVVVYLAVPIQELKDAVKLGREAFDEMVHANMIMLKAELHRQAEILGIEKTE